MNLAPGVFVHDTERNIEQTTNYQGKEWHFTKQFKQIDESTF